MTADTDYWRDARTDQPEPDTEVLGCTQGGFFWLVTYDPDDHAWYNEHGSSKTITHWQPLPPAP